MTETNTGGLNNLNFDTRDLPSMGDIDHVEAQVREMASEAIAVRKRYNQEADGDKASTEAKAAITAVMDRWAKTFSAGNTGVVQTLSPQAQDVWLREHGFGSRDEEPGAPVKALVATVVKQVLDAAIAHENGAISDEDTKFRVDVAIEDCVAMLMGVENGAEGD